MLARAAWTEADLPTDQEELVSEEEVAGLIDRLLPALAADPGRPF